jgi:superfamily II DNA or RNA helicase
MVNLTHPELSREELAPTSFPEVPSEEALWDLRSKACSSTQAAFTLQTHQRFLRRVLSPDAPTRGVLVVHGTGTGKTCTAIQVAEEYILRPEYQDKKVLVVSSAAVEETFRDQIFDMSRVKLTESGLLESKQCTGRRYLEMLQRIESNPKNWADATVRDTLEKTADKLISEFYEFVPYASFGNLINEKESLGGKAFSDWAHATFDNRLVIIDEAHNIRPKADVVNAKAITAGLERLTKTVKGMILVLLTATPMYEAYDELMLYFNLFRWNEDHGKDEGKPPPPPLLAADFFDEAANLKEAKRTEFEALCQTYVSYVKGENPFTFPFRLPAPRSVAPSLTKTFKGEAYTQGLQYLSVVESPAKGLQAKVLQATKGADDEERRRLLMQPTVAVLPKDGDFDDVFTRQGDQYAYRGEPFLGPATLPEVSAKFVRVLQSLEAGEGIVFVYSNYVTMGALLFAMALEEHGYGPFRGAPQLANPAYRGRTKGSYILLTSKDNDKTIANLVSQARREDNRNGERIRVIISSPLVAEGVDFRCVRQAHILDPWWNMSRIEQVIGRSLRTCSHTLLESAKQNCTVYLHVVRTENRRECYDEYTYRTKVEAKAEKIARVRTVLERAAMDCPFRVVLPAPWLSDEFKIAQQQSEGRVTVRYSLSEMLPPAFTREAPTDCAVQTSPADPDHVRPLSAILDVRDELLDKLGRFLLDKPIWDKDKLLEALKPYRREVSLYTIQQAIDTGTRFRDAFNRQSILESKGSLYALLPVETAEGLRITTRGTLTDRVMKESRRGEADLPEAQEVPAPEVVEVAPDLLATKRADMSFPGDALTRFAPEILDAYVFDHKLTESEKRAYLRANPEFGDRVRVPGTEILVRGANQFDPDEPPIGDDEERVAEWTAALATRFSEVIATNTLFASLNAGGEFTLSKLKAVSDTAVVRAYEKDSKTFKTTTCGTGCCKRDTMTLFAKTVDKQGVGLPVGVTSVPQVCVYCELLAREEHACAWFTPEEMSVLYGPDLSKRFATEFKKTNPS